jgi:glycosyltransferase involved in cell wall biosynthesis
MKILRIIGSVNPNYGGPIEGLIRSSEVLSGLGHVTEVASLDNADSPFLENFPLALHAFGGQLKYYGYAPGMIKWLRENATRFDMVIQHGLWNYTAFATWSALRNSKTPYFVFTHGMLDPWFRETYPFKHLVKQICWWFSEGRLLRDARAVLFTSEEERLLARREFWPWVARESVVGYGTADVTGDKDGQIAAFRTSLPALGERSFLLFLSRIDPKKGCDILIRAFVDIASLYPDLDLVMAGPDQHGWQRDLENIVRSAGIADRVHWTGMVKGDVKWGAYRAAEAFVLPSHSENFGIVVAEALACSVPVLITTKVNIWHEVETGGGGLVSRNDVEDFSRILREFLAMSDDEKRQLRARSRAVFTSHFEINSETEKLMNSLARLTMCASEHGTRTDAQSHV